MSSAENQALTDALLDAGAAAGMHDPTEAAVYIKPADMLDSAGQPVNAAALIENLKKARPHLFKPDARQMTDAEFAAAKAGIFRKTAQKQAEADANAGLARRLSRFQTTKE